jgi:alginate O-acetyltransferase complex protein AlgI
MVFSDLFFLFVFIPAFALCYLLAAVIDRKFSSQDEARCFRAKNMVLVMFSLVFYAWGEPVYVFLMLASVFINYLVGLMIHKNEGRNRRWALTTGLAINIAILGTFKYLGFFCGILADVGLTLGVPKIALPIGISFYTFQSISYLVDVYRKESPVQHRFVDLLLYISMFPQLIAGPIVRYGTVADEINDRHVSASDFAEGSYRFFIGLGKKVILANQLSEISDQFLVNGLGTLSTSGAWIGIIAFTLQIYFDFSGYSDMAIGMGRCLGFHFNENFRHPYCCDSITDFWRRWHISLGSFFRDYVYIPMGGNRRHQAVNIFVVWFLTGMWHGASWNFIIWGVYFGLIVMLEKYTILRIKDKIPSPVLHLYSLALVVIGWGIFYFDDFHSMQTFFNAFWGNAKVATDFVSESALLDNFWLWVAALLFCLPLRHVLSEFVERSCNERRVLKQSLFFAAHLSVSLVMLICSVALLVGATNNAFIYTRF